MKNFRPVCKKSSRYEGILGKHENGDIATGGNIMHQHILWGMTKEQAEEQLSKIAVEFPQYEFKLITC